MRDFKVIGLMSGSSLDGVDIAYVNFSHDNRRWFFQIVEAGSIPYSEEWKNKLSDAFSSNIAELKELDIEYGKYLLHNTDYTVSRVAEECGYRNDVHFMRQFKEITGSTPSQYRKRIMFSRKM